ncbi:MAG: hypothetical protein JST89_03890 [Cyanobacteria bacterium SZAS-4]|nr:hypothetical protein [Cyanobacteria bacterium SZAS-4]
MLAHEPIIEAESTSKSLIDEKIMLVKRLDDVEKQIQTFKYLTEFLQRMSRLDKHLQAPDHTSDLGKYESAVADLSALKARLSYVRSQRSKVREFACFLGLADTIPELEQEITRRAWRVDQLCRKLKLIGNLSLQEEYQILDDHLDGLMAKGFAPVAVASQILALETEIIETHYRLAIVEEQLQRKQKKNVSDFSPPPPLQPPPPPPPPPQSYPKRQSLFTHLNFWDSLERDLNAAQKAVVIVSPYLTVKRSKQFIETFEKLLSRKVDLKVITLPEKLQTEHMVDQSTSVIESLVELGVEISTVPKIHQKIIVIDDKICWEGSMNWLSHRDTAEHIRRIDDAELVAEVNASLDIYVKVIDAQFVNQPAVVTTCH